MASSWLVRRNTALIQGGSEISKAPTLLQELLKVLNSPVVVTLIGGLLIALATNDWQARDARLRSMETTMVKFANQYGKLLNILPTRKDRELKLRELLQSPAPPPKDTRAVKAWTEAIKAAELRFESTDAELQKLEDSIALSSQARAIFQNSDIDHLCDDLDRLVDEIGSTSRLEAALALHSQAIVVYRNIVGRMGFELRNGQ